MHTQGKITSLGASHDSEIEGAPAWRMNVYATDTRVSQAFGETAREAYENAQRLATCWNACANLTDPAAAIEAARDSLRDAVAMYEKLQPAGGYQGVYEMMKPALAELGEK